MEQSLSLGRIAGVSIGVHWSVLVIAWLIGSGLAIDLYPEAYPGYGGAEYAAAAAVTVLAFLASLVAHELGHALVARRLGVGVRTITLWMLGGAATLEEEATSGEDELRIGAVGPAVSIGLGLGFGGLAWALDALGAPSLVIGVAAWLAVMNIVLAVFNLLPAFPMDGGRVLRAALWMRHGDELRATRTAASAGRVLGYTIVGLGMVSVLSGAFGGLWFVIIGMFIAFAARMETAEIERHKLLGGVTVGDVMTPDPLTAPSAITVQELLDQYVLRHHVSAYPLLSVDGSVDGLITLDRLRRIPPERRSTTPAGDAACPLAELVVTDPDDEVAEILPRLMGSPERRALAMRGERLVGIVSHTDIGRALEILRLTHPVTGG
jgi:Zn-dependent protease